MCKTRKIRDGLFIEKRADGRYYPYGSWQKALLGIVSPSLMYITTQKEMKELYEAARGLGNMWHKG